MLADVERIEVGEIFIISNGEFSEYSVFGIYRALREINVAVVIEICKRYEYIVDFIYAPINCTDFYKILADLVTKGYCEKLESKEIYLGACNRPNVHIVEVGT